MHSLKTKSRRVRCLQREGSKKLVKKRKGNYARGEGVLRWKRKRCKASCREDEKENQCEREEGNLVLEI